ncbi:MAG: hypothetical protein IKT57_06170 [Clostridia bacterium]|nr:hypothetical protein [Clostridia bacterium]
MGLDENATKAKLVEKLYKIDNNREFVLGVISFAKHVEDRNVILEYIEKGQEVSKKNLLLLALELNKARRS